MTIAKYERPHFDLYEGPRDEMISAGLVRADQIPPSGKNGVSFLKGVAIKGRCDIDENYLRVDRTINGCLRVKIGVPTAVKKERRTAERQDALDRSAQYLQEQATRQQQERQQRAETAQRKLNNFIRTENEYRQYLIGGIRRSVHSRLSVETDTVEQGYSLDLEGLEDALLSCDAIVEVLMSAKINFNSKRHTEKLAQLQQQLIASSPSAHSQVALLTRPNAAILEGEAA